MNQSTIPLITPANWGPRGRGAEITYTIVDSPFGRMLVVVTSRGICALSVHQSDEWQENELRRDFPEAKSRARLKSPVRMARRDRPRRLCCGTRAARPRDAKYRWR